MKKMFELRLLGLILVLILLSGCFFGQGPGEEPLSKLPTRSAAADHSVSTETPAVTARPQTQRPETTGAPTATPTVRPSPLPTPTPSPTPAPTVFEPDPKRLIKPPEQPGRLPWDVFQDPLHGHVPSKYFKHHDYYNMKSGKGLTILENFKTYQQMNTSTCGPAAVLMVLEHFGVQTENEVTLADSLSCSMDDDGSNPDGENIADDTSELGTLQGSIEQYFEGLGWNLVSNQTMTGDYVSQSFFDPLLFRDFVLEHLTKNRPIIVLTNEWGGHYQVIIGYDTMDTERFHDDVLILADPADDGDHLRDGYVTRLVGNFYYHWLRADTGGDVYPQPFIVAWP